MDINDMRVIVTLLGFICFIGIVVWAYSQRVSKSFEEAEALPFADDRTPRPERDR
jgi:cytochrome c oxidase cbb3-type subunit 4